MADRIERRDAYGDEYSLVRGDELLFVEPRAAREGAVAGVHTPESLLPAFTEEQAIEAAQFFLEAAGVDIVGAARRVAEAHERAKFAVSKGQQDAAALDILAAIKALIAELAKLEGGA